MDDCKMCEYLDQCRAAAAGAGPWPRCPWTVETVVYNPNLKQ